MPLSVRTPERNSKKGVRRWFELAWPYSVEGSIVGSNRMAQCMEDSCVA